MQTCLARRRLYLRVAVFLVARCLLMAYSKPGGDLLDTNRLGRGEDLPVHSSHCQVLQASILLLSFYGHHVCANHRSLQPPVPSPSAARNGKEWIHSGQLGQHTRTSTRPPRPNGLHNTPHHLSSRVCRNDSSAPVPPPHGNHQTASVSAVSFVEEGGATERESDGPSDAWSCCARTAATGGRGCEPREPVVTVSGDSHCEEKATRGLDIVVLQRTTRGCTSRSAGM